MPIHGLTNTPRLPRLGKIRLGIKMPGQRSDYPKQTDYFVCPPEVQEVYGEKPKELDIVFPTDDDEQWADPWYKSYSKVMGLLCKGDGLRARRKVDLDRAADENGELPLSEHPKYWPMANYNSTNVAMREIDCPQDCPVRAGGGCKQVLNLQYMLPKVDKIGIYQTDTSSWNSIRNIRDGIHLIKSLTRGRIGLIPMKLALIPMDVQPKTGPKHIVHVLQLTFDGSINDLYRVLELPIARAILPSPDDEVPDDLFPDATPEYIEPAPAHDDDTERRIAAWNGVQDAIKAGVTKAQVVRWLRDEAEFTVGQQLVGKDEPPDGLPTEVIERLHDSLTQSQLRLGA